MYVFSVLCYNRSTFTEEPWIIQIPYRSVKKLLTAKKEWDKLGVHKQVAVAIPVVALILCAAYVFVCGL